jgi:transcriptional regulator with XRE-family HTH domain
MGAKSSTSRRHRDNNPLAARIYQARRDAGLTQQELAEQTGISQFSISKYENGHTEPRARSLRAIAQATDREIAWFYSDDGVAA